MNRKDDSTLLGEFLVYRRIPPFAERVQWENDKPIPASQNFKDHRNELSVHLSQESTAKTVLKGHDGFGLVQLALQHFRDVFAKAQKPLVICRDDEDPANGHVLICGDITNGMAKSLKRLAVWVEGFWPAKPA